ncbi:hypothetical protein KM043_014265 [Ampulex compressa]|nr:hypothetical protein KM043_014265 [Ampulex compressa]
MIRKSTKPREITLFPRPVQCLWFLNAFRLSVTGAVLSFDGNSCTGTERIIHSGRILFVFSYFVSVAVLSKIRQQRATAAIAVLTAVCSLPRKYNSAEVIVVYVASVVVLETAKMSYC